MNVELVVRKMMKQGVITGPNDPQLRRREFEIEEWQALHPLVQEYFCIVSPRQVDQVLAEIAAEKKGEMAAQDKAKRDRAMKLHEQSLDALDKESGDEFDAAVDAFVASYQQYCGGGTGEYGKHNYATMMAWMREHQVFPNDVRVLIDAFESLAAEGKLYVNLQPLGLGDRIISGYALQTHDQLDRILQPVRKVNFIDQMSANQYREYNNKVDRDAGVKQPRSQRAEFEAEKMFSAWIHANPGYGIFENQTRADVKALIIAHMDEEQIPWSASAVAQAAEYLHRKGMLHRESDVRSGQSGESVSAGARLVVHQKSANPLTSAPPAAQPVEITENKPKRFTAAQIRAMSSATFAENLKNPAFAAEVDRLFNQ
jgi:hypothetical protein